MQDKDLEKVLESIRSLLPPERRRKAINAEVSTSSQSVSLELSVMVLLIDLALVDQEFNAEEYRFLLTLFNELFGLEKSQVRSLMNEASSFLGNKDAALSLAQALAQTLSEQQRKAIIIFLEELIRADGKEDGFEMFLKDQLADILSVTIH